MSQLFSPLVSIIIPAYNRQGLILETLESIANQFYTNFECLVVDDGSTDLTVQEVEEFRIRDDRFVLVKRPSELSKGAPSCRNLGLQLAKGQFIQFFDSDDLMEKTALQKKVSELIKHSDIDFTVSRTSFLTEQGAVVGIDQFLIKPNNFLAFLQHKTMFFTPGPMFRVSFLKKFRVVFDHRLPRHQEFEFYTRMMMSMPSFSIIDEVHCYYRLHEQSIKAFSDNQGNLFYRYYKCLAINRMNLNSGYIKANDLYDGFKAYFITTIKVAVYHGSLIKALNTIVMFSGLYISRFRRAIVES